MKRLLLPFCLAPLFCLRVLAQEPPGRFEIRAFGGAVAAGSMLVAQPAPSAGFEGAVYLNRVFAVTGRYAYERLGSYDNSYCVGSGSQCYHYTGRRSMHEFVGGVRFTIPNRSRIAPYVAIGVGGARWITQSSSSYSGYTSPYLTIPPSSGSSADGITSFAVTVGAGANLRITRRMGFNVEATGLADFVYGHEIPGWILHPTAGFYYRF